MLFFRSVPGDLDLPDLSFRNLLGDVLRVRPTSLLLDRNLPGELLLSRCLSLLFDLTFLGELLRLRSFSLLPFLLGELLRSRGFSVLFDLDLTFLGELLRLRSISLLLFDFVLLGDLLRVRSLSLLLDRTLLEELLFTPSELFDRRTFPGDELLPVRLLLRRSPDSLDEDLRLDDNLLSPDLVVFFRSVLVPPRNLPGDRPRLLRILDDSLSSARSASPDADGSSASNGSNVISLPPSPLSSAVSSFLEDRGFLRSSPGDWLLELRGFLLSSPGDWLLALRSFRVDRPAVLLRRPADMLRCGFRSLKLPRLGSSRLLSDDGLG